MKENNKMTVLYPSQEWCDAWKEAINNSEDAEKTGKNWGLDFNGTFLFEILPDAGLDKATYIYLNDTGGKCKEARIVSGPDEVGAGYHVKGPYSVFKKIVKGELHFIESLITGKVRRITGDMGKLMRNASFIGFVAESISSFEAEYLRE